jgi:hypothetical protein
VILTAPPASDAPVRRREAPAADGDGQPAPAPARR